MRLFLTLWLVYLAHWSPFVVRELYLTISLVERGTVRVDPYVELHPDLFTIEGRGSYVGGNPGAAFAATVPYWLAQPLINYIAPVRPQTSEHTSLGTGYNEDRINRLRFFRRARELGVLTRLAVGALVTSGFFMAPLTALGAVVLARVLARMGFAPGMAILMGVLFGLGTPYFLRAGTLSLNGMVGLCGLFAFAQIWRPELTAIKGKPHSSLAGRRAEEEDKKARLFRTSQLSGKLAHPASDPDDTLLDPVTDVFFQTGDTLGTKVQVRYVTGGFLAGWAVLTDYTGAVVAAMLGLFAFWLLWRKQPFGQALIGSSWFLVGAALPVTLLLCYQWYCFGDPWLPAQFHMPRRIFQGYPSEHGFGWPLPAALWGLIFDPQYGLLVFSPVFALALYHPVLIWRKRNLVPAHVAVFAWLFFAAQYVFCSMIHYTVRHQWQDGVRYIVPALPLVFLLVADVLARTKRWFILLVAAAAVAESWAIAMVRSNPLDSIRDVLNDGVQYPWLSTLKRVSSDVFPSFTAPGFVVSALLPWAILTGMLAAIGIIWTFRRSKPARDARH